jgi:hypothetical protein
MPRLEGNGGSFEVHCSGAVLQKLRDIQRQATEEGRGEALLAAIRQVLLRLRHGPMEFGEPLYYLPALRMHVRHGGIGPLFIRVVAQQGNATDRLAITRPLKSSPSDV